ncbi:aldehyde dehydrogenase family protein [Rhizobium leguminosarum]|uniref:aldehyde dehydrogenase family protein n=1 Tax=Rhizobium leguminosarum TaxID=384 RepID=UPI0024B3A3DA|nr:aldehyde dehydrogenase family protein [Rhizobium leguminosarum]WHO82683.1 aldehyde dehydrogenase family protein [Rhizobium leguminosarum]
MKHYGNLYIDGMWVAPENAGQKPLINPFTETAFASVVTGGGVDEVNKAVAAARRAFETYSKTTLDERAALIDRIIAAYEERADEIAEIMAQEVGIPVSARAQTTGPIGHMKVARDLLKSYHFERHLGDTIIRREPIGVCALISPWNWPVQTPVIKAIYGLAAGCALIMKPSDASPVSAIILAEIFEKAGVPQGVFNLIIGRGRDVGAAMASHPDVDLVSFTGSTQAGAQVGEAAARTIKRVSLELGGKSANIVLMDADLEKAARWNIQRCFFNTGQSCHAPSRMLVHESQMDAVVPFLVDEVARYRLGDPRDPETTMGPVVNQAQFDSIQRHIQIGIDEGARLACGGTGKPEGRNQGFFVKPTVFADVSPDMTIAREEIFGPVLAVIPYQTEQQALEIANDSIYGLGGYVFGSDRKKAYEFASGLRAGRICFNGAATNSLTPMGGYKQSGIGRSMGSVGLEEYLEIKSVYGFDEEASRLPEFTF